MNEYRVKCRKPGMDPTGNSAYYDFGLDFYVTDDAWAQHFATGFALSQGGTVVSVQRKLLGGVLGPIL